MRICDEHSNCRDSFYIDNTKRNLRLVPFLFNICICIGTMLFHIHWCYNTAASIETMYIFCLTL